MRPGCSWRTGWRNTASPNERNLSAWDVRWPTGAMNRSSAFAPKFAAGRMRLASGDRSVRRRERELLWLATPCFHGFSKLTVLALPNAGVIKGVEQRQAVSIAGAAGGPSRLFMDDGWPRRDDSWIRNSAGFVEALACTAPRG